MIQAKGSLIFPFHITEIEEDEMHARIKSVKAIQDDHNQSSLSYCWGVTFLGLWYSCQWRDGEEKSLIGLVGWGWKETFSVWSSTGSLDNSLYEVLHAQMGLNCDKVSGLGTMGIKVNLILVRSIMRDASGEENSSCEVDNISVQNIPHIMEEVSM